MTLHKERRIGRLSVLLLLNESEESKRVGELERDGWKVCLGKVGSMDAHKVVAAIETASKKAVSFSQRVIVNRMRFIMRRWRPYMV